VTPYTLSARWRGGEMEAFTFHHSPRYMVEVLRLVERNRGNLRHGKSLRFANGCCPLPSSGEKYPLMREEA